jgi:hypothetical protein
VNIFTNFQTIPIPAPKRRMYLGLSYMEDALVALAADAVRVQQLCGRLVK